MNKKKKVEISAFYDLYKKEKGEKMFYKFKCEKSCKDPGDYPGIQGQEG